MSVCCCSLAGTAACQHCRNNPFATDLWTNTVNTTIHVVRKSVTNADRIRAMSDKDLADLLSGGEPYPWCEQDPCPAETCQECILMWLKQEAKE